MLLPYSLIIHYFRKLTKKSVLNQYKIPTKTKENRPCKGKHLWLIFLIPDLTSDTSSL